METVLKVVSGTMQHELKSKNKKNNNNMNVFLKSRQVKKENVRHYGMEWNGTMGGVQHEIETTAGATNRANESSPTNPLPLVSHV